MSEITGLLSPTGWAPPRGYSNGVVAHGRIVVLAGQIGWNPSLAEFETDDFVLQVRQCLENIMVLLGEAGASSEHLVRLTWFITDRNRYIESTKRIGEVYRDVMGRHFPPMSVIVVSGLMEERALVEIEATAVIPE
ncbi:MAG: RidA family protein [Gemmatimonadota bacterium]